MSDDREGPGSGVADPTATATATVRESPEPAGDAERASEDLLTLQEAADLLRVHYMTAYRWVRRGDLPAFKTGGRLRLRRGDVDAYLDSSVLDPAMPPERPSRTDWSLHLDRFHGLLLDGRGSDAMRLVRRVVADGASATEAYVHLIAPALHRIGEQWACGDITVSEEHRASEITGAIIARMGEHFRRRGPVRGVAVSMAPPGEHHGIASAMVAQYLRGGGWEVHHLGPNVPLDDLTLFLEVVPTDAVCVSVTRQVPPALYDRVVEAAVGDPRPIVVFGGQGVHAMAARSAGGRVVVDLADLLGVVTEHIAHAEDT